MWKRIVIAGIVAVGAVVVPAASASAVPACDQSRWVGSWAAAPSDAGVSHSSLSDQTLRMIIAPHLRGGRLRIRLTNRFGASPVTLGPVTIGLRASRASLSARSMRAVRFGRSRTVTIPAGGDVVSDPVSLAFRPFQDLAISVAISRSVENPTEHAVTRQTSYLTPAGTGDHSSDTSGGAFTQTTAAGGESSGWYFLDGLDVLATAPTGAVVAFGDSITDGFQGNVSPVSEQLATIDTNGRYPDDLQRRIIRAGLPLSVLNAGISGNRVLSDGLLPIFGPNGLARFQIDALAQSGVSDVIVLEGINDIGQTAPGEVTVQQLETGYQQLIAQAHAAGLKVQLGTLTPVGGTLLPTYGVTADQVRVPLNQWIRSQRLSDGTVDFDAAVRDPSNPSRINPAYDGSDHVHFNLAGYRAMAGAVNLRLLRTAACTRPRLRVTVTPRHVHRMTIRRRCGKTS